MNKTNVIQISSTSQKTNKIVGKCLSKFRAKTLVLIQWTNNRALQFWKYLKRKDAEAALVERRSLDRLERYREANWDSMRRFHI
jgi:hypothetical protein